MILIFIAICKLTCISRTYSHSLTILELFDRQTPPRILLFHSRLHHFNSLVFSVVSNFSFITTVYNINNNTKSTMNSEQHPNYIKYLSGGKKTAEKLRRELNFMVVQTRYFRTENDDMGFDYTREWDTVRPPTDRMPYSIFSVKHDYDYLCTPTVQIMDNFIAKWEKNIAASQMSNSNSDSYYYSCSDDSTWSSEYDNEKRKPENGEDVHGSDDISERKAKMTRKQKSQHGYTDTSDPPLPMPRIVRRRGRSFFCRENLKRMIRIMVSRFSKGGKPENETN